MKVRQLIEQLQSLDPNLEVIGYLEDETLPPKGESFIALDVVGCEASEAAMTRLESGSPYLSFGKKAGSSKLALLELGWDKA